MEMAATASYINWNSSSTIPNWVRYKLFLYEALVMGYPSYFRIMVKRSAVVPKTTVLQCLCIEIKIKVILMTVSLMNAIQKKTGKIIEF
jgi:hypothetical protein